MNALLEILRDNERKTLARLGLVALVALAVGAAVFARQKSAYFAARDGLARLEEESRKAVQTRDDARAERGRWDQASRDLESLRTSRFYDEKSGIQSLRLDLEKIFNQAGMTVSGVDYGYSSLSKEQVKKTIATFTYTGSYAGLKRLLGTIERFPKFLIIEKVDFTRTGSDGGAINLRLTLAGYYGL